MTEVTEAVDVGALRCTVVRRTVGAIGRGLVTAGILILLFVAFQLWGTGLYTAREQSRLKSDFDAQLARAKTATTTTTPTPGPTTTTTPPPPPPEGEAVSTLKIPGIGIDDAVVQGVNVSDLRKGPGHYPETPMPGQLGNAAIAGHRTTYGAPFNRLDELKPGDEIIVNTLDGPFRYLVDEQTTEDGEASGHVVVTPRQVEVLEPTPNPEVAGENLATLTLTTCNPKYSASTRLVVTATFSPEDDTSPEPTRPPPITVSTRSNIDLSGADTPAGPTVWWGAIAVAVGGLWWFIFHRYHRWTTWVAGLIPFAVVLFTFFWNLERVLPANY